MPRQAVRRAWGRMRAVAVVVMLSLVAAMVGVLVPTAAYAAGTVLFQNSFANRTVDGTGTVTKPTPTNGTNVACLTATGNSATLPLLSCSGTFDAQGSGKLRLTDATTNKVGGVFGKDSFPTSNGLDVTFTSYQWGGNNADGIAFMLGAVDPANPVAPTSIGPSGGSLGYSPAGSVKGLANAYLGIGLDVFGNFSSSGWSGTGCTNPPNFGTSVAGAVVARGPGNGLVGYCGLTTTYDGTAGSKVALRAATRAASAVPVQVLINPTGAAFTSDSGVSVSAGTYKVVVTPVGQSARTLSGPLPTVASNLYPSSTWLTAAGLPKQLAFAFVGSTGSVTDNHEISNAKVLTFNPVPQLAVSTTSYSAATSGPGAPVTYQVATNVLAGADVASPISVTHTVPTGVVPVGAYGTGWVCAAPVGKSITCTTSASAFADGTALPALTVDAIVTGTSVSAAVIQSNSTTVASSTDASPATDSAMTAGTVPAAPTGVGISPAIGSITGGGLTSVTASTNNIPPTAIYIGTVAEQQAGTPVVLLPCPSGRAVGCFNIEGNTMVIASMPARAGPATVTVTVVSLGIATATTYVYASSPAVPATPTATAGITSATLTWAAPVNNGSAITGYVVTPYLGGVAQATQTFDASTTTRTLTGLTPGGSYTFTVAATNAYGTSAASAQSAAVVPYALPAAPVISAATAGSQSAVLTWTAPNNGGSAITGYVVTPYIGAVAQPPQTFAGTATTATVTGLTAGAAYTFKVAAQNLAGTGPQSAASTAVTPNQSPGLTFAAPPAGQVGVAYSQQLTVTGGTAPFTWSISSGTLPAGLTLNATTGLLSGTPTAAGSSPVTIRVVDASGQIATRAVTLVIAATPGLVFTPAAGEVGVPYGQQPTLTGGTGPFTWRISAGSLPAGVTINAATGLVSGTPTASGNFSVTVAATDIFNQVATATATIVIVAQPAFTATSPPSGQIGVAYSHTFAVTGGALPLTWSISAGSLPAGLSFNSSTGVLSGTPTAVGSSAFTVSVVDAKGQSAAKPVTVVIGTGPLVITAAANVSSTTAGATVAYTVTITNIGSTSFTGVTVTAPLTGVLDDAVYNGNVSATSGTPSYSAPNLGWTGNIGANATITVSYSVTVNNPDVGNKVLATTVTSTPASTNCVAGSTDTRCSVTVTVAGLTILKTATVATTTPGSTIGFQVVITNDGQTAYPAATFTDNLAGVLDDGVYNADAAATTGNISYTSPSLTWTGALAPGASATLTYTVTVANPDVGNRSLTGTVVSSSAGSPCPSGNPAPSCTATVTVLVPGLSITNTASVATTTPGGVVNYTVTISNTGQTPYTGTSVTVAAAGALDDAIYGNDLAASAGSVAPGANGTSLVWTGNLAVGGSATVTSSMTVRNPDPGDRTLTVVASSAAPGSTCPVGSTNPACTSTVQVLIPGLTIARSTDVSTTTPGSVVHYTVSVTNSGQTPYTGATVSDALAGVLDDAVYNGDAAATTGTVSVTGSTLTWTGDLAVAASATITYSVTVNTPDTGNLTLVAAATSTTAGSNCPVGGPAPACSSSVGVLIPGLSIVVAADPTTPTTPGQVIRYTLTVTNTGQTPYTAIPVTLHILDLVDDATPNNDGLVSTGDQVLNDDGTSTWTLSLAPGAVATTTVSVTVNDPATGNKDLHPFVTAEVPGSTCPTGSTNPDCTSHIVVLVPGLIITKTADTATISPGGTVGYTITVTNTGETSYPAAEFSDSLAAILPDAIYAGGATATSGALTYTSPVLSWSGALAPAASATISYSVTVRDPDPGDKLLTNTAVSSSAGSNCAAGSTDARCTAIAQVLVPGLTIVTTASTPTTAPGAVVGYSVALTNSGATTYTGAAVAANLAGVLDDATYNNDAAVGAGTLGYSAPTLTWTGNLAPGATTTVSFSVTVRAADVGDDLVTATVSSAAAGSNCAAGSPDSRCTATVPVARLVLTWDTSTPTTTPGSIVALTATYTNTGQVPYVDITVSADGQDAADDGLPGGDQTATSGTLTIGESGGSWIGSIPIGGVVTVGATMQVRNPDTGNKLITVTAQSTAPGTNCPPNGTDSRCTLSITVLEPGLTITKVASTTATVPGGTVGYTITVTNTGQTAYTGASVTDPLDEVIDKATYNGNAATTSGAVSYSAPTLTWTGDLAPSASATITYSVTASSAPTGDKIMVNSVSSAAVGSTCPPSSTNAACRSTVLILTPALTLVKTADLTAATLGSTVTYTITATNSGQVPFAAAEFTDSLAGVLDDAAYGTDSATSGTVGFASGVLSWSGALAPGSSATVTYTVTVDNPSTGNRTMANTVVSTTAGNNCPSGAGDTRCTATVAVTDSVSLTFTTRADVVATVAGGEVNYTTTVHNSSTVSEQVDLTDALAGVLDDATYNDDAAASGGTVTFDDPDLGWTGTVPAGGTITVTYSVTVNASPAGDRILTERISSTSLPGSNNCGAASTDPECTTSVTIAALLLEQHYTETSTTPGSVVHLNASFTNTGTYPYTGITIASPSADTVDDAVPNGDQVATSGSLVLSAGAITWTGNIPVGGTVTVVGTLTVKNPDPGNKLLTGTLTSTALGNNCPPSGTDLACVASLPVLLPGLTLTKVADTTYVVPGGTASYTITVHNSGEYDYIGATVSDTLVGLLDDATYNAASLTTSGGAVSYATPVLTWTGDLAVGATVTIAYSVTALSPATGDKTMVNPVSSEAAGSTCPPASGNTACRSTIAVLTPALTITSAASAPTTVPGATVTYTIVAANTGQTPYPAANLSIDLADVLDNATYTSGISAKVDNVATVGTAAITGSVLTWTDALNPGSAATITFAVSVSPAAAGDYRLHHTVTSTSQGTNCPAASTDPRCATAVLIASLHILSATDVATTQPTRVVTNTVTYTNTGQVPYVGTAITNQFLGSLDDVTYNGDVAVTSGSLAFGTTEATWTGDIPVGGVVTVTGSFTVNNPDLGDKHLITLVTTEAPASNCPAAGPGPDCATDVLVQSPGLTITKTAGAPTVTPGSPVGYTITVHNTGETPYTGAVVRDPLAGVLNDSTYADDGHATSGVLTYADSVLTWTGDLALGQTATITYQVHVTDPDLGDKSMVNRVTSDEVGSTCPTAGSAPAGCATLVTVLVPALDIAVAADRTTAVPGSAVGYTVTIRNTGQVAYTGATVTAQLAGALDDAAYPGGATTTTGTLSYATPNLTWTGNLAIGASTVVAYSVTVADPDTGNRILATSVTSAAAGSTCGAAAQCANSITVLIPGLAVSTTASAATTTPGNPVTFTITVANTGQTPYTGTVVSTALTGILDDATFDGEISASSGVPTHSAPDLSWTGTLGVGETATISYTVTVRDPDPGDRTMTTTVLAPAAGSTCRVDSTDPACTATVTVLIPALSISKTTDAPTTTPGGTVEYTILVTNTGETDYSGAVVTDSLAGLLPDSVYAGDAAATSGVLTYAAPVLTWTGDLSTGATATITYSITVRSPDPGDKAMTNAVTSSTPGSTCPPDNAVAACTTLVRVLVPALVITKTADVPTVTAGNTVHYTVTLANTGQTAYAPATFTDPLTDVLDDATYAGDAASAVGTFEYTNNTLAWSGPIDVGATATITYSVTTRFPATGDHLLANTVVSASPGSTCTNGTDPRCSSAVAVLVPALLITKTTSASEVVAGGRLDYTVTATNTGQADYPTAALSDSLTGVLDDAGYNGDATATRGTAGYANGVLSWAGPLPIGDTVVLSYSVTATTTGNGDAVLVNQVGSTSVGSVCGPGATALPCVTTTPVAARTITLADLTPSFTLTGLPNTTVSSNGTVTMTVTTNSASGYLVSVQPRTDTLTGAVPGNNETIPIGQLGVRESGTDTFRPLSDQEPLTVHDQDTPSAPGGDAISNDYQVQIPFVPSDTYSAELDYIVSAP